MKDFSDLNIITLPIFKNTTIRIKELKRKIQFKLIGNVLENESSSNDLFTKYPVTIFTVTYSKVYNCLFFTNMVYSLSDELTIDNIKLVRDKLNELNIGYENEFEDFISLIMLSKIVNKRII